MRAGWGRHSIAGPRGAGTPCTRVANSIQGSGCPTSLRPGWRRHKQSPLWLRTAVGVRNVPLLLRAPAVSRGNRCCHSLACPTLTHRKHQRHSTSFPRLPSPWGQGSIFPRPGAKAVSGAELRQGRDVLGANIHVFSLDPLCLSDSGLGT